MRRVIRPFLVGVLAFLMSFNPAVAWHFCGGGGGRHGGWGYGRSSCGSGYYGGGGYCGSYGYSNVVDDSCGGGCGSCGYDDGCGSCDGGSCGGWDSSCDGCGASGSVIIDSDAEVYHESAPVAPTESAPWDAEPQERTAPPATVNKTPPPTLESEPARMPESELTTPPAPADDLFNTTEPSAPEKTPLPTEPVPPPAEDDTFGTESTSTPPAEPATGGPATTEPADDFFSSEPAADGASEPMPETPSTESTPADESGTSTDSGGLDELFGTPPADGSTPATDGTAPAADETAPGEEMPAAEDEPAFDTSSAILSEPGGLASTEMRAWVDNTGSYSCNGRLINILESHARLLKDNGRTTTVPLYRLSASDLAFLHRQASAAAPRDTLAQAAASEAAEVFSAN